MAMESVYFRTEQDIPPKAAKQVKRQLAGLPGVLAVSVGDSTRDIGVDFDSTGTSTMQICSSLETMGYNACLQREEKRRG